MKISEISVVVRHEFNMLALYLPLTVLRKINVLPKNENFTPKDVNNFKIYL